MIARSRRKSNVLTGVEMGTSTVKVVVGEFSADGELSVLGFGEVPSMKVAKGEITDHRLVEEQLEAALARAEKMAGAEISDLFLAITGAHIRSVPSSGHAVIHSANRRITEDDVVNAVRAARAYHLPPDRKILHCLDRRYIVDDNHEVPNPIDIQAARLEADVLIVYGTLGRIAAPCDLITDIMGQEPTDIAFSGIAAALGAFAPDQLEQGALVVDIGAGITEYTLFSSPGCFHAGQIAVGCNHIINDISLGLGIAFPKARQLLMHTCAVMTPDGRQRVVEVGSTGGGTRRIPVSTVEQIVELRLQELFELIVADLRANEALSRVAHGVTLVGGGAMIDGVDRLATQVLSMPAYIGRPSTVTGPDEILDSPRFVTPVGLLRWGKLMLEVASPAALSAKELWRREAKRLAGIVRRSLKW